MLQLSFYNILNKAGAFLFYLLLEGELLVCGFA